MGTEYTTLAKLYINIIPTYISLLFLPSSPSNITTDASLGSATTTPLGNDDESIKTVKYSLPSNILSSIIEILKGLRFTLELNVKEYDLNS